MIAYSRVEKHLETKKILLRLTQILTIIIMLPINIGYEVKIDKSGNVEKVSSSDFVDLPEEKFENAERSSSSQSDISTTTTDNDATISSPPPPQTFKAKPTELKASIIRGQLHNILSDIPVEQRQKARSLLVHMLSSMPEVDFDQKNQLFFHDKAIPNSNVGRIVASIVSPHFSPLVAGEKEILSVLTQNPRNPILKSIHPTKLKPFVQRTKRKFNSGPTTSPYYFPRASKKELLKKL